LGANCDFLTFYECIKIDLNAFYPSKEQFNGHRSFVNEKLQLFIMAMKNMNLTNNATCLHTIIAEESSRRLSIGNRPLTGRDELHILLQDGKES
jgi:hypothetical protein